MAHVCSFHLAEVVNAVNIGVGVVNEQVECLLVQRYTKMAIRELKIDDLT